MQDYHSSLSFKTELKQLSEDLEKDHKELESLSFQIKQDIVWVYLKRFVSLLLEAFFYLSSIGLLFLLIYFLFTFSDASEIFIRMFRSDPNINNDDFEKFKTGIFLFKIIWLISSIFFFINLNVSEGSSFFLQ